MNTSYNVSVQIQISLLGKFAIAKDGGQTPIPVRSYAKIYALLAISGDEGITRQAIIRNLWPLDEFGAANNRLRVALTAIRKELKTALLENENHVRLDLNLVEIDIVSLRDQIERLTDELDETIYLKQLSQVISALSKQVLPEVEEHWCEKAQTEWMQYALETLDTMDKVAWEQNQLEIVIEISKAAIVHEPYSDTHWQSMLKASAQSHTFDQAIAAFQSAKAQQQKNIPAKFFSSETIAFAQELQDKPAGNIFDFETAKTLRESEYFSMLVVRILENNPELARAIFGSFQSRQVSQLFTDVALPILKDLVEVAPIHELDTHGLIYCYMGMNSILENPYPILEHGLKLLEYVTDPKLTGKCHSVIAVAYIILQKFDLAFTHVQKAAQVYRDYGFDEEAIEENFVLGSCYYHTQQYDKAIEVWEELARLSLTRTEDTSARLRGYNLLCNCAIAKVISGDEEGAWPIFTEGMTFLIEKNSRANSTLGFCGYGYLKYSLKNDFNGLEYVIDTLKQSYKSKHIRAQQIASMYVGVILVKEQKYSLALAVFDYLYAWRDRTLGPLSPAEKSFADRAIGVCLGAKPAKLIPLTMSEKDYLQLLVRELRLIKKEHV